jgi:hypothetical protein
MTKLLARCFVAILAGFPSRPPTRKNRCSGLAQMVPLRGVKGRINHIGIDLERKR